MARSKLTRFGFEDRVYSNSPTGLPTADCANVVLSEMGSMTAPVTWSMGAPAWTARVPKPWTGDGARGGVSIGPSPGRVMPGSFSFEAAVEVKARGVDVVYLSLSLGLRRKRGDVKRYRARPGDVEIVVAMMKNCRLKLG